MPTGKKSVLKFRPGKRLKEGGTAWGRSREAEGSIPIRDPLPLAQD